MSEIKKWNKLVSQLKVLLETLPTREERDQFEKSLSELINILNNVGVSLSNLPTAEEAEKAKQCLEKLEFIVNRNPLIGSLTFKPKKEKSRKTRQETIVPSEEIQKEIEMLSKMQERDIINHLNQDEKYTKEYLLSMLHFLHRKVPSKTKKDHLINEIAVAITTHRTYDGLRNG